MLRRQRAIEIVPSSKRLRWRRYDVPQHLAPETGDALRFCAVEGDLELPDRRHRSTIEAGSSVVSTGPPLERWGRRVPELAVEQVGNGEHGRAAGQEYRAAVSDGEAQPGGAAGQPQPARAGGAHYVPPMR